MEAARAPGRDDAEQPLAKRKCLPCAKDGGDSPLLAAEAIDAGLKQLCPLWAVVDDGKARHTTTTPPHPTDASHPPGWL